MHSVLQAVLHFIYWDALPDIQELVGLDTKSAVALMAQHLPAAADQYGLTRLRALCDAKLSLVDQHHRVQLKAGCLKFIALPENLKAVMQRSESLWGIQRSDRGQNWEPNSTGLFGMNLCK